MLMTGNPSAGKGGGSYFNQRKNSGSEFKRSARTLVTDQCLKGILSDRVPEFGTEPAAA